MSRTLAPFRLKAVKRDAFFKFSENDKINLKDICLIGHTSRMFLRGHLFLLPLGFLEASSCNQQSAAYWLHRTRAGFSWQHDTDDGDQATDELLILAHVVSTTDDLEET